MYILSEEMFKNYSWNWGRDFENIADCGCRRRGILTIDICRAVCNQYLRLSDIENFEKEIVVMIYEYVEHGELHEYKNKLFRTYHNAKKFITRKILGQISHIVTNYQCHLYIHI